MCQVSQSDSQPCNQDSVFTNTNTDLTTVTAPDPLHEEHLHQLDNSSIPQYDGEFPRRILLTGVAGFIGGHLCETLLLRSINERGYGDRASGMTIVGVDNLNDYYDRRLKLRTLEILNETARTIDASSEMNSYKLNGKDCDNLYNNGCQGNVNSEERRPVSWPPYSPAFSPTSSSPASLQLSSFQFRGIDLRNFDEVQRIFAEEGPFDCIIHLAAQAGVRYSIQHPVDCVENNVLATLNLLECASQHSPSCHFIMASSSSVYGCDSEAPFDERVASCNRPLSVYAASKKSTEMFAHSYHQMYKMPITMFRFFTVYGPRGRPDMSVYKFIDALFNEKELPVYGDGSAIREFTYISDIIDGLIASIRRGVKPFPTPIATDKVEETSPARCDDMDDAATTTSSRSSGTPCHDIVDDNGIEVFNIGGGSTHTVMELIQTIEAAVGKKAKLNFQDEQLGDVPLTTACQDHVKANLGFEPKVSLQEGVRRTVEWYQQWAKLRNTIQADQSFSST